jgi:hypothetical protein
MAIPKDKNLYERIKKKVYKEMPTHSAYRSGILVKKYKEAYKKKYGDKEAYEGKKPKDKGLERWFKEEWRTQEGKTTYQKKGDIFRPTKRITKETPTTLKELTKEEIKRGQEIKKRGGRVKKFSTK